jgi:hypothetical protein
MGQASPASLETAGISAGVQLATTGAALWLNQITLSHDADTATTQIVNALEPKLRALVAAYLAGPGTCADQAAAISAYLTAVNELYSAQGCGNGSYGSAGNRCISDRFGPGGPTDGNAKYPWATWYYAPIANDPRAAGCAAQVATDNPNAALEAAINNLGNGTQTTAGSYDTTGSTGSSAVTVSAGSSVLTESFLGFPIWVWAAGLGAFLLLK